MPSGREGPASFFLAPMQLVVEFLVHDPQGGEEIAKEEEEEGEAAHEHLEEQAGSGRRPGRPSRRPLQAGARLTCHSLHSGSRARLNNVSALKSCQNWEGAGSYTRSLLKTARWTGGARVQLTCPKKRKGSRNVRPRHIQDWKPSAGAQRQRTRHSDPGPEARTGPPGSLRTAGRGGLARLTHSEVHGVPLAQGPQAVQTAALVVILEELHKTWRGRGHQDGAGVPRPCPPFPGGRALSRAGTLETLTLVHGEGQELVPELLVHEPVGPESREQRVGWALRDAPPSPCPLLPRRPWDQADPLTMSA